MKEYENIYYALLKQAQHQTRDFRENDIPAWAVLKSMIKREPNYRGMGLWNFIECAMIGWKLKEMSHGNMPQEKGRIL